MSLFKTTDLQKIRLYEVATMMKQSGLEDKFIVNAVEIDLCYEGVFDLFDLWADEEDQTEKDQVIADIQDEVEKLFSQNFEDY